MSHFSSSVGGIARSCSMVGNSFVFAAAEEIVGDGGLTPKYDLARTARATRTGRARIVTSHRRFAERLWGDVLNFFGRLFARPATLIEEKLPAGLRPDRQIFPPLNR